MNVVEAAAVNRKTVRPLAPPWLQSFVPLIKDLLQKTADRKYQAEGVVMFDATDLSKANWSESSTMRCEISLATRTRLYKAQERRGNYNLDVALDKAMGILQEKGSYVLNILHREHKASAHITLVIKDGEVRGVKYGFSEPIRR
jgi:hypothetical protein